MSRRIAFVSLFLAACGGAAAPAGRAPDKEAAPEPSTVEEAQQQIAQAKSDLAVRPSEPAAATGAGAAADESPKTSSSKKAESDYGGTSPTCQSPCRAIASMRRAVGALCRMTGDADARCTEAKRTLQESEMRVASCGC